MACVFLVVDNQCSLPASLTHKFAMSQEADPHYCGEYGIVSIMIISWAMRRAGAAAPVDDFEALMRAAKRKRRYIKGNALGTIDYQVIASYRFDQVFELRLDELKNPFAPLEARNDLRHAATSSDLTMDEIVARRSVDLPSSFVRVAPQHAELIVKELTTAVRVCLVSDRTRPDELLPCGPPAKAVQKWARQLKSEDRARFITEDRVLTLLELPPGTPDNPQSQRASRTGAAQYDAVEFLRWMRFARHLHAQENVAEAADDALDAVLVHEVKQQVEAGRTRVPRKTALMEGRMHLDATDMLLERRYFKDLLTNRPDDLICVLFFSDGSPVSGTELQAMIMDLVMRGGDIITRILPGVALAHGQFGVMSKAFALLWAYI